VKSHPVDPCALAQELADEGIGSHELLDDICAYPDLYYADHLMVCRQRRVLPLSDRAWRRVCQTLPVSLCEAPPKG
jgi:hypothetical protein